MLFLTLVFHRDSHKTILLPKNTNVKHMLFIPTYAKWLNGRREQRHLIHSDKRRSAWPVFLVFFLDRPKAPCVNTSTAARFWSCATKPKQDFNSSEMGIQRLCFGINEIMQTQQTAWQRSDKARTRSVQCTQQSVASSWQLVVSSWQIRQQPATK